MPLDVLEVVAGNGVDDAPPRRAGARGLKFDLMVKVLQRDDPLRRSYLQMAWHRHPTSVSLSRGVGGRSFPTIISRR
jgi:hypothetical protein